MTALFSVQDKAIVRHSQRTYSCYCLAPRTMLASPHIEQCFGQDIRGLVEPAKELGATLLGALGGFKSYSQRRGCIHGVVKAGSTREMGQEIFPIEKDLWVPPGRATSKVAAPTLSLRPCGGMPWRARLQQAGHCQVRDTRVRSPDQSPW